MSVRESVKRLIRLMRQNEGPKIRRKQTFGQVPLGSLFVFQVPLKRWLSLDYCLTRSLLERFSISSEWYLGIVLKLRNNFWMEALL